MSKNVRVIAGALALIVVLVSATVAWVGVPLVKLAYFEAAGGEPYLLLDFFSGRDSERYAREARARGLGGEAPVYALEHLLEGRRDDGFESLHPQTFARGREVVQWVTSASYRDLTSAADARTELLGGSLTQADGELGHDAWPGTLLVIRTRATRSAQELPVAETSGARYIESLLNPALNSSQRPPENVLQPLWAGPVAVLDRDADWDYVFLYRVNDEAALLDLLRGEQARTDRAVLRAAVAAVAIGVYRR